MALLVASIALFASVSLAVILETYVGAIVFTCLCYLIFCLTWLANFISRPNKLDVFYSQLRPLEKEIYRRFHWYVRSPARANLVSGTVNMLRFIGIIWALVMFYHEFYWLGGVQLIFYAFSGALIANTAPNLYWVDSAEQGNPVAQEQLHFLDNVVQKYEKYVSDN